MPSQKTKTKCTFLTPVSFSLAALFTTLQCLIFCQLLFTIFSPISVSVNAVYIFPLRLSPKYYIPGLLEPPKSRSAHQLNSLHKALKYLHTSKSAAEVTNAFLRKISEDSESSESSPTSASTTLTSTTTGATVATRKTTRNSGGNSHALPLNEQITGKFADQLRSSKPVETEFEEKLVLIVFKLPVKRTRERQRRYKRQRPSLQFYQRSADPNSMVTSSSRTMSIGNKIRSWWEGSTGNQQQRPTSSTPKFQPTYKFTYSEGPIPYNSERPWAFRSTTARTSNANSNSFLNLDKFFWKSTAQPAKRPPRPGGGPPPPNPTSGRGILPSPSTTPFLSFGDYYFNGPGCQPRGPKLILCTTDRIEHLSNLLEKFMHYHEKNNLQYAKQAQKFVEDDYDDYNDSRGDESNYKFRVLGKNVKNKKKKPKGYGLTPKKHPSVVVVAMNRDEEIDDLEDHHEDDDEFMAHRSESLESIIEDHDDSSHEHDDDEHLEKDPLLMIVKGSGKRPEVLIQGTKGKNKSPRTKRKLKRSHNYHDLSPPFTFSEEMRNYDYAEKEGNRDRYFYFLQNKKKNLDDDRDHFKRNKLDERIRETEAEYKRLNMLLELVKKYQELA